MSLLDRLFYKTRKHYDDDFDWDSYTSDSYARQLDAIGKTRAQIHETHSLRFDAETGAIVYKDPRPHENTLTILELIGRLQPSSVLETGCGGGDHLASVSGVFPGIICAGTDRGATQLDLLKSRHPWLADRVLLQDLTMPFSKVMPKAELVYSQAVVMHLHTAVSHFVALSNMINAAERHVFLMENLQCHNFYQDVLGLYEHGHTNWDQMYFYRIDGPFGARGLLLSKEVLDYPQVSSDAELREGLNPSERRLKRSNEDSARAIWSNGLQS